MWGRLKDIKELRTHKRVNPVTLVEIMLLQSGAKLLKHSSFHHTITLKVFFFFKKKKINLQILISGLLAGLRAGI